MSDVADRLAQERAAVRPFERDHLAPSVAALIRRAQEEAREPLVEALRLLLTGADESLQLRAEAAHRVLAEAEEES